VNNVNDQLDAKITILLIFESAQHVSGKCLPETCWADSKINKNVGICWLGGWVVPRASLGVFQMRKISHPFEAQMVQPVPPFTGFSRFSSMYECKHFMEAAQCALNNRTCAVFWKFICNTFRQQ